MKRSRDPLHISPHWHVDCRIEVDLPEDNLVGTRFIINMVFTAFAVAAVLFTGWLGYKNLSMRYQIRDWERRINDNRAVVSEIQQMGREYNVEAAKIDQAYALIRPQLFVSGFIMNLGRTRPEPVGIDIIEWNDTGIVVRGSLRERSERATRILGLYVEELRRDKSMQPIFREISLTDLDRGSSGDTIKFEIVFRLKPFKA
jgi:hypothetical protein